MAASQEAVEIMDIFDEIITNNLRYCAICLRTENERKLVQPNFFMQCVSVLELDAPVINTVCFVCEASAKRAMQLMQAINFSFVINHFFKAMSFQLNYKGEMPFHLDRYMKSWPGKCRLPALPLARSWALARRLQLVETDVLLVDSYGMSPETRETVDRQTPQEINSEADNVVVIDDDDDYILPITPDIDPLLTDELCQPRPFPADGIPSPTTHLPSDNPPQIVQKIPKNTKQIPSIVKFGTNVSPVITNTVPPVNTKVPPKTKAVPPVKMKELSRTNSVPPVKTKELSRTNSVPPKITKVQSNYNVVPPENTIVHSNNNVVPPVFLPRLVPFDHLMLYEDSAAFVPGDMPMQMLVRHKDSQDLIMHQVERKPNGEIRVPSLRARLRSGRRRLEPDTSAPLMIAPKPAVSDVVPISQPTAVSVQEDNTQGLPAPPGGKGGRPGGRGGAKPVHSSRIDWEDKIPMDVISFVDATDPNAEQFMNPEPFAEATQSKRPHFDRDIIDLCE